jgi:hypothetical protein
MTVPFVLDNFAEAVHHAIIRLGAGASLQLTIGSVSVERLQ